MEQDGVIYGGSESYRHMCRFERGFFFQEPLMQEYRYYWRVEPETFLYCNIDYDVFQVHEGKQQEIRLDQFDNGI